MLLNLENTETQSDLFRAAMRRVANTVAIVTAGAEGHRNGFTASSYCTASDSPPTIVVCISTRTSALRLIQHERRFGLNFLCRDHSSIADEFAGRRGTHGESRFGKHSWRKDVADVPILGNALVSLVCETSGMFDRGNFTIVVGMVHSSISGTNESPLLYADRAYWALGNTLG